MFVFCHLRRCRIHPKLRVGVGGERRQTSSRRVENEGSAIRNDIFLVCMAVPICAACGSVESSPKQAAQTLFTAMSKGDVETVRKYTYLVKGDKLSTSKPEQGVTDVQVGDEIKNDSTGSVNMRFKVANKQEDLTLSMHKDPDSKLWQADGSQLFVKTTAEDSHHFLGGKHVREEAGDMMLPGVYQAQYHGDWYSGTWKENIVELGKDHYLDVQDHEQNLEADDGIKTDAEVAKALRRSLMHLGGCNILDEEMDLKHPYFGKNKEISGACQVAGNGITDASKTIIASYDKHPDKDGNFLLTLGGTATAPKGDFIDGFSHEGYQCESIGESKGQCVKFVPTSVDMTGIQVSLNRDKMEVTPANGVETRIAEFLYAGHGQREGMPD